MQNMTPPWRILRLPDVASKTGMSRTAIYDNVQRGLFPRPIRISLRMIGWLEHEVDGWIKKQVELSRPGETLELSMGNRPELKSEFVWRKGT